MASPKLIISTQGQAAREVALNGSVSVGRAADNTVSLDDPSVARYHAIIEKRGDGYWLSDLGSVNGTQVNGQPVAGDHKLEAGDVVSLGGATLKLAAHQGGEKNDAAPVPVTPPPASSESNPLPSPAPAPAPQPPSGLSAGMVGAAVAVGLLVTVFLGTAVYLVVKPDKKTTPTPAPTLAPTFAPTARAEVTPTTTPDPGQSGPQGLDVRLAAQSLAQQLTGRSLNYYTFEPEFLSRVAERVGEYRAVNPGEARRFQREVKMAFNNAGVKPIFGFILAMSESKFQAAAASGDLWQLPPEALQGEGGAATADAAARHIEERLELFGLENFMYAVASYRLTARQAGELNDKLEELAPEDRRNFWKLVASGVVPPDAAEQVVRFFAAGIVGENPASFGLPSASLSDL
jgi:pSer/pThr/pTyr-binding forkhead associated (FHA) protein